MRCLSCDKRLNGRESTRKYASSGTFIDLCDRCFSHVSEEIADVADGYDPTLDEGEFEPEDIEGETGLSTFDGDEFYGPA